MDGAAHLLNARLAEPFVLGSESSGRLPRLLSRLEISGGAVHDAMVALTAAEHEADLATRDARARTTYQAVDVRVVVAG